MPRTSPSPLQPQVLHVESTFAETQPGRRGFEPDTAIATAVGVNLRVVRKRVGIDKITADLRDNVRRRLEPCRLDDLPDVADHQGQELRWVKRAIELVREVAAFDMVFAMAVQPSLRRDDLDTVKLD